MPRLLPALLYLSLPTLALASDEAWRIDTVHTQIHFSIDHLGYTQSMGLIKVREGRLRFDPANLSDCELDILIEPATLLMGDAKWQETVTSWQFLNTKRWPHAHYTAQQCEQTAATTGIAHGKLNLHGKSMPVDLTFHVNKIGNDPYTFKRTAGFSAQAQFKRSAFGMNKLLSAVGDNIVLRIEVEAVHDRSNTRTALTPDDPAPTPPETSDDEPTQ